MYKIINQFRRIYFDNGSNDVDFSHQEEQLRLATNRLIQATQDLIRASEYLNNVARSVDVQNKQVH